jgi:hypothetical protein
MLFVGERRGSRRLPGAIRAERAQRVEQSNIGSRVAVLRRRGRTCFSSASDEEVGVFPVRSAASGSEQSNADCASPC